MAGFFRFSPILHTDFDELLPPIEDFINSLYLESAKIYSLSMYPKNIFKWVELMAVRYHQQLETVNNMNANVKTKRK